MVTCLTNVKVKQPLELWSSWRIANLPPVFRRLLLKEPLAKENRRLLNIFAKFTDFCC